MLNIRILLPEHQSDTVGRNCSKTVLLVTADLEVDLNTAEGFMM